MGRPVAELRPHKSQVVFPDLRKSDKIKGTKHFRNQYELNSNVCGTILIAKAVKRVLQQITSTTFSAGPQSHPKHCKQAPSKQKHQKDLASWPPSSKFCTSSQSRCHPKVPAAKGAKGMASDSERFSLHARTGPCYWATIPQFIDRLCNKALRLWPCREK